MSDEKAHDLAETLSKLARDIELSVSSESGRRPCTISELNNFKVAVVRAFKVLSAELSNDS